MPVLDVMATRHSLTVNRQEKRGMFNPNANAVIKTGIYMSSVTEGGFSLKEELRITGDVMRTCQKQMHADTD